MKLGLIDLEGDNKAITFEPGHSLVQITSAGCQVKFGP